MPNYDFECAKGHIFEANVSIQDSQKGIPCRKGRCKQPSTIIWLSPRASRMARNFSPTLLFVNKDGKVIMPGRNNPDHLPKKYLTKLAKQGFQQREITNFREYESFIREQRSILKSKQDEHIAKQQEAYNKQIREQIESFRRGDPIVMPNPDGKGSRTIQIRLDDLSPAMKQLAEYSMEQALNHRIKGGSINPYIQSMEFDNTSYRDIDTNWKRRK